MPRALTWKNQAAQGLPKGRVVRMCLQPGIRKRVIVGKSHGLGVDAWMNKAPTKLQFHGP